MKINIDSFNGHIEVDWSLKEDVKFIISICIEKLHRYVYDVVYNQKTNDHKKFKNKCIAKAHHIITYKLWRHWRTFYMIGCERYKMTPNRVYSRLDGWYKII